MREFQSPDEACAEFAKSGEKLLVKRIDDLVFIEGTEEALTRFAELVLAQARYRKDDGFEVSPNGPGSLIFADESNLGIYLRTVRS